MAGRLLLDSNAVIAFLANDAELRFKIVDADEVFISTTVLGELYYGAAKSSRVEENIAVVDRFARTCSVLVCTGRTAHTYGHLKAALKDKGKPIPENDLWIAAVAVENDLTLMTRDVHFESIDGLKFTSW